MNVPYPPGATLVKVEYDDDECSVPVGYTVMFREAPGYAPETFDWRWQKLDAERNVLLNAAYPPRCIACHVTHCNPPRGAGFELTCVDDSGAPPTTR